MTAFYPITNGTTVPADGYFQIPGNFTPMFVPGFSFAAVDSGSSSPQISSFGSFIVLSSAFIGGQTQITLDLTGSPVPNLTPSGEWLTLVGGAYNLDFSDVAKSTLLVPVASVNQDTSLKYPGRASLNYGELINENFLHVLENFANSTAPISPIEGQLWFDNVNNELNVTTNGTTWDTLLTGTVADATYLRLDATNDPITGTLTLDGALEGTVGTNNDVLLINNDILLSGNILAFGMSGTDTLGSNIDHIWYDDTGVFGTSGIFYLISDGSRMATNSNAGLVVNRYFGSTGGSITEPTYSFVGDEDTGIYNVGANTLGFVTNGAQQMRIDSSGGVFFSNELLVTGGSAGDPSYTFDGDPDTGMYSGTVNVLRFSTAGVERLEIEANGTLNVAGTADYETLVTSDDDIPNKKYVDDQIVAGIPGKSYDEIIISGSPISSVVNTTNVNTTAATATTAFQQVFRNGILQRESTGSPLTGNYTVTGVNQITFFITLNLNDEILLYQL